MANRYWVGGSGNWDASTTTHWSATDGGAGGASVPTASDDVYLNGNSGAGAVVTITVSIARCRSLICTGFGGTLAHAAGCQVYIGTTTAGPGNVAMLFVAGMTYTASTGVIQFVSTSATLQTITTAGKAFNNVIFNGSGAAWIIQDSFSVALSITRSANGTVDFTTNSTLVTFTGGVQLTGTYGITFYDVTVTGSASIGLGLNTHIVQHNLVALGTSGTLRAMIFSMTFGTQRTFTVNGSVTLGYIDFRDIAAAGTSLSGGATPWTGTLVGDQGNNDATTISFTPGQTLYFYKAGPAWNVFITDAGLWFNGTGGTGGAGRVPLPQDTGVFDAASVPVAGCTIKVATTGVSNYYGTLDFRNIANNPTVSITFHAYLWDLKLKTGLSLTTTNAAYVVYVLRRDAYSFDPCGLNIPNVLSFYGNPTLAGPLTAASLNLGMGTFNDGGYDVNLGLVAGTTIAAVVKSGNWTLTAGGGSYVLDTAIGITDNGGTWTISDTNAAQQKGFGRGGNNRTFQRVIITGDNVLISGNNTFGQLDVNTAGGTVGLKILSGTTQTVTTFTTNGHAGALAKLVSGTGGSKATLASTRLTVAAVVDYMSIQDIWVTPANQWWAGSHSTNVSGNSGWLWKDPLALSGASGGAGVGHGALQLRKVLAGTSAGIGTGHAALRLGHGLSGVSHGVGAGQARLSLRMALKGTAHGLATPRGDLAALLQPHKTILHKRGLESHCPALGPAEIYYCTDSDKFIVGTNGTKAGNKAYPHIPSGGTAAQFLRKQSGTDYDAAWATPALSELASYPSDPAKYACGDGTWKEPPSGGGLQALSVSSSGVSSLGGTNYPATSTFVFPAKRCLHLVLTMYCPRNLYAGLGVCVDPTHGYVMWTPNNNNWETDYYVGSGWSWGPWYTYAVSGLYILEFWVTNNWNGNVSIMGTIRTDQMGGGSPVAYPGPYNDNHVALAGQTIQLYVLNSASFSYFQSLKYEIL